MQPLQRNPETGFLESNKGNSFTSEQKLKFLQIANDAIDSGHYPMVHELCKEAGVNIRTFEVHVNNDSVFGSAWQEIRKKLLSVYTGKLAWKADSKMGTLANLAMLKYLESGSFLDRDRQINPDYSSGKSLDSAKNVCFDAEIVPTEDNNSHTTKMIDNQSTVDKSSPPINEH